MTTVILLSIVVVALVMIAMAVGALFSNRCLRGSCGGPDVLGPDGQALSCGACPRRSAAQSSTEASTESATPGARETVVAARGDSNRDAERSAGKIA